MRNGNTMNVAAITKDEILEILQEVKDPEIPAVSVIEMGMVREVIVSDNQVKIVITPTYSGCPAMGWIHNEIKKVLELEGISNLIIETRLSPAWTTDWMSEETKLKLKESGIAPPQNKTNDFDGSDLFNIIKVPAAIICPFCDSDDTKMISEFGSTACKSLHYCNSCLQGFDHFKCH